MRYLFPATIAAVILAAHSCIGQGTITFANTALSRVQWENPITHVLEPLPAGAPVVFGVLWGTAADDLGLNDGPLGTTHPTSPGIIAAANPYPIVGAAEGALVFMKIAMWNSSFGRDHAGARDACAFYGETGVRQVRLASAAGPGTIIWSASNPALFQPLRPMLCPEPSVMALGALGAGSAFLRWRSKRTSLKSRPRRAHRGRAAS